MGIDLAWSPRNNTGIAILKDNKVIFSNIIRDISEIRDLIQKYKPQVIAVDAPLTITNETGNREAEKYLNKVFRVHDAGAYPANRKLLGSYNNGKPRGEEVKELVESLGYEENGIDKAVIEVYPHAAQIRLSHQDKIIKYKKNPTLLASYEELLRKEVNFELTEAHRKKREDILDAIMCAIVAKYYHNNKYDIFGGHIVVPKP